MEFKVRAVDFEEEKSTQEIEQELLDKHEQEQQQSQQEEPPLEDSEKNINFETEQEQQLAPEVEETNVLSYIKNRYNKEINTLDELFEARSQNEELPSDVSSFLKFKKETGRGIEDFIKYNRDVESEDPDKLLFEYIKEMNPDLDSDEVAFEVESKFSFSEDYDDEKEIKNKTIAKKKELAKAKEYFNKMKEQYMVPLESSKSSIPQEDLENYNAYKQYAQTAKEAEQAQLERAQYFAKKTDELFNNEFKGFEFSVGDSKFTFKPADAESLKKSQSNLSTFISSFLDDNGFIKDPAAYHRAIAAAMNPEGLAKYFYEQGKADATQSLARESKNIDMGTRQTPPPTYQSGFKVVALDSDHGTRLKIKSNK